MAFLPRRNSALYLDYVNYVSLNLESLETKFLKTMSLQEGIHVQASASEDPYQ